MSREGAGRPRPESAVAVVTLDALGTLVELEPPAPLLREQLYRRFAIRLSAAQAERAMAAEIAYYRAHLQEGRDAAGLADLRSRCAEVLRDALPDGQGAGIENRALTDALLASLRFRPFPDAGPALRRLRDCGRQLIALSNWDASLPEVLGRAGIAPLLDGVITSAASGWRKPSREIFAHALDLAGARPEQALHVGDSLAEDIVGATSAGIRAVLLQRGGESGPPGVPAVPDLIELARLICPK